MSPRLLSQPMSSRNSDCPDHRRTQPRQQQDRTRRSRAGPVERRPSPADKAAACSEESGEGGKDGMGQKWLLNTDVLARSRFVVSLFSAL
jgi:hypothetical protein